MAPKKHSISVRYTKGLNLSSQERAALKKAYKTSSVHVLKPRKTKDHLSLETNIQPILGQTRARKPSKKVSSKK